MKGSRVRCSVVGKRILNAWSARKSLNSCQLESVFTANISSRKGLIFNICERDRKLFPWLIKLLAGNYQINSQPSITQISLR
jgi:hypothetical protein